MYTGQNIYHYSKTVLNVTQYHCCFDLWPPSLNQRTYGTAKPVAGDWTPLNGVQERNLLVQIQYVMWLEYPH